MRTPQVVEMPDDVAEREPRLRPLPPPIWPGLDRDPSPEEVELALALFRALSPESQAWYRRSGFRLFKDIA